jgi:hypothetical protein
MDDYTNDEKVFQATNDAYQLRDLRTLLIKQERLFRLHAKDAFNHLLGCKVEVKYYADNEYTFAPIVNGELTELVRFPEDSKEILHLRVKPFRPGKEAVTIPAENVVFIHQIG